MKILCIGDPDSGVVYHRIYKPFTLLKEKGLLDFQIINYKQPIPEADWEGVTHVIFSRALPFTGESFANFFAICKATGKKVIIDNDDWWHLALDHPSKATYDKANLSGRIVNSMYFADEVWTTQKYLADKIKKVNRNVHITPNGLDPSDPQWQITRQEADEVRFGYVAGISHLPDLVQNKIDLSPYESYVADIGGYPQAAKARFALETQSPNEYGKLYQAFDVALAPLIPSEFNRCKSNLKMVEAGFAGCALIVSDVAPYSQHLNKNNCIAVKHKGDWASAIKYLHQNPNKAGDIALTLHEEMTTNFNIHDFNDIRFERLQKMQQLK